MTAEGTAKLRDIEGDPHINLGLLQRPHPRMDFGVGLATVSRDREKIEELYAPDWKVWFSR